VRARADRERIEKLLRSLGRAVSSAHVIYLAGGASAVIDGWRESTLDVDLRPEPDSDQLLRAVAELKDELDINVELASPLDFLPELAGWRERSPYVAQYGQIVVRHMDFRLQALSKLERASEQDLADARAIVERGLATPAQLDEALAEIQTGLFRFPAVDRDSFTARVRAFVWSVER
jgi:hypothetical protein